MVKVDDDVVLVVELGAAATLVKVVVLVEVDVVVGVADEVVVEEVVVEDVELVEDNVVVDVVEVVVVVVVVEDIVVDLVEEDVRVVEDEVVVEEGVELDEVVVVLLTVPLNSRSRLLELSASHMFPETSKANPPGDLRPVWLVAPALVVKLPCPRTAPALNPLMKRGTYSRSLLLPESVTQRLPERSNPRKSGTYRPLMLVAGTLVAKVACPITSEADSPVEKGGAKATTLLLKVSVTQRPPVESNATSDGSMNCEEEVPGEEVTKDCWPSTREAAMPVEKGALNSSTLLFPKSATQRFPIESKAMPVG